MRFLLKSIYLLPLLFSCVYAEDYYVPCDACSEQEMSIQAIQSAKTSGTVIVVDRYQQQFIAFKLDYQFKQDKTTISAERVSLKPSKQDQISQALFALKQIHFSHSINVDQLDLPKSLKQISAMDIVSYDLKVKLQTAVADYILSRIEEHPGPNVIKLVDRLIKQPLWLAASYSKLPVYQKVEMKGSVRVTFHDQSIARYSFQNESIEDGKLVLYYEFAESSDSKGKFIPKKWEELSGLSIKGELSYVLSWFKLSKMLGAIVKKEKNPEILAGQANLNCGYEQQKMYCVFESR